MAKLNESTVIWLDSPAQNGARDASVVGGGTLWATLRGAYANEIVTLWRGDLGFGGYTGVLQDISDKFPSVRKLYADGKILDAERVLTNEFQKRNYKPRADKPLPIANLEINFAQTGYVANYSRVTDMAEGQVSVGFKTNSGNVERNAFVARGSDIFAYSATAGEKINCDIALRLPDAILVGGKIPASTAILYDNGFVSLAVRNTAGLDYGFVMRIDANGGVIKQTEPNVFSIQNAESLSVYAKSFNDSNRDTEFKKARAELGAIKSYDKLFASASGAHEKLFKSYELNLDGSDLTEVEFADLLSSAVKGRMDSPVLTRLWNLGKYLSICGVKAGDITLFNAAQLLYCGSTSDIIQDIVLDYFAQFEKYVDDLRKNGSRIYGARGYCIPSVTSPKCALLGSTEPEVINFIASSALAANIFYRYYLLTGDAKVLKARIFPFMREVMNFYGDILKVDTYGKYTTIPSYSPNATPGNTIMGKPLVNFAFATNATIDFLAIGCLLDNLIDAAKICGAAENIPTWQDMKTKFPAFGVTPAGHIREYTNSPFIDKLNNVGSMHAYGLWPIKTFSFGDKVVTYQPPVAVGAVAREVQIGLRAASFNAMVARLELSGARQDARSTAICALQASHAGLGTTSANATRGILLKLLSSVFSDSGLCMDTDWRGSGFTKNGTGEFDVVGNVAFTNAITECVIQSNKDTLRILPSVFEGLNAGKITDVCTDFAARVSIEWDIKKGKCIVKIVPKVDCKINIEVNREFRKVKSKDYKMNGDINGLAGFALVANKAVTVEFA